MKLIMCLLILSTLSCDRVTGKNKNEPLPKAKDPYSNPAKIPKPSEPTIKGFVCDFSDEELNSSQRVFLSQNYYSSRTSSFIMPIDQKEERVDNKNGVKTAFTAVTNINGVSYSKEYSWNGETTEMREELIAIPRDYLENDFEVKRYRSVKTEENQWQIVEFAPSLRVTNCEEKVVKFLDF